MSTRARYEPQVGGVACRCPIEFRHQVARLDAPPVLSPFRARTGLSGILPRHPFSIVTCSRPFS